MKKLKEELRTVLVTDCGSTTTKALLFEKTEDGWRQTARGEAPTTVEKPVADVTVGALNAFTEIQELTGRTILKDSSDTHPFLVTEDDLTKGIDLYLSTSSAGGGLQMMVSGVVSQMTTESAERAALGAGAIVLEAVSADDEREEHERIERIRHLRPDIVLLTGGVDGGSEVHVVEAAETLLAAAPRPRFGDTLRLPVIYAGNANAAEEVKEVLAPIAQISVVENIRPTLEVENLGPAREAIHEFFLTHVMSHSPGYDKLLSWTPLPVMPTPAAVGDMVSSFAKRRGLQVLCADIGGATTDVFSVFRNDSGAQVFNRTVSANLGMSYSIANVLIEAGTDAIARWLNFELDLSELRDRLRNKMIRPTSIPQTKEDLWLEQAVCREALRLSLVHHRELAVGLSGAQTQRGISDIFSQKSNRYELVNMMSLDLVIGSGGVLSHAPRRLEAAMMMLDGFGLEGVTEIAVDSIFMMPHLGVLASLHPEAAEEIFLHDCLVHIAHAVVPVYSSTRIKRGAALARVMFAGKQIGDVLAGEVTHIPLDEGVSGELVVVPVTSKVDVGAGPGKKVQKEITLGLHGFLFDGRNRPHEWPESEKERIAQQQQIVQNVGLVA
ncbi:MAG: glutamate mutase L [Bdellovibrionales bacterium]|nr:glutamate mutase L [Bdellovibrionales bacterium]